MTARKLQGAWWVDFQWVHQQGPRTGVRERVRKKSPVDSKRGAEDYERLLRERLSKGMPLDGSDPKAAVIPTFAAFAEEFLDTYVVNNNKPSERESKRSILRMHLVPVLGTMRLDLVREREIEHLKAKILRSGVTPKRLKNILAVLSKMLRYAHEIGLLESAPRIRMPKLPPTQFDFLADDEYERLLRAADDEPLRRALIVVAREAGLRKGEILALEWGDVDLVARTLTVRRSVWYDNQSVAHVGAPKSGRERRIPMTSLLHATLSKHRHLRGKRVFCNDGSKPLTPGQIESFLATTCRRAGLRSIGWHVLRHTFASHLAQRGASPKAIQELLGHSEMGTTMRYMHLAPAHHREAVALLEGPATLPDEGRHEAPTNPENALVLPLSRAKFGQYLGSRS